MRWSQIIFLQYNITEAVIYIIYLFLQYITCTVPEIHLNGIIIKFTSYTLNDIYIHIMYLFLHNIQNIMTECFHHCPAMTIISSTTYSIIYLYIDDIVHKMYFYMDMSH